MMDKRPRAPDASATTRARRRSTRRAARLPWSAFAVTFVVIVGVAAVNDFVPLTGAALTALLVGIALVPTVVAVAAGRAPEARARGVAWLFGGVLVLAGLFGRLAARFGARSSAHVADVIGLHDYPSTVAGMLCGAVLLALVAMARDLMQRD
jgi:hypothetical protein